MSLKTQLSSTVIRNHNVLYDPSKKWLIENFIVGTTIENKNSSFILDQKMYHCESDVSRYKWRLGPFYKWGVRQFYK